MCFADSFLTDHHSSQKSLNFKNSTIAFLFTEDRLLYVFISKDFLDDFITLQIISNPAHVITICSNFTPSCSNLTSLKLTSVASTFDIQLIPIITTWAWFVMNTQIFILVWTLQYLNLSAHSPHILRSFCKRKLQKELFWSCL